MRDKFQGFYQPNDEEIKAAWEDKGTLFVFDTSTLLNIYSYADQTRTDFFSILEKLQDQIWLPYHVGLEYQRRRLEIIKEEKAIFQKIHKCLNKIKDVFESDFEQLSLKKRFPELFTETEELKKKILLAINDYNIKVDAFDKKQPCVRSHDAIRDKLTSLFAGRVGEKPEQSWLDKLYEEGKDRFDTKTPPGYEDIKKENKGQECFTYAGLFYKRIYGDLIIWKQIIQRAKHEDVKAVIFVTDDGKKDWWFIINSRGEKKIGPRAELREEICREASINFFIMYNTATFLETGKSILKLDIQETSIDDANTIFLRNLSELYKNQIAYDFQNDINRNLAKLYANYQNKLDNEIKEKFKELLTFQTNIDLQKDWIKLLKSYNELQNKNIQNYIYPKANLNNEEDDNDDE